MGRSSERAGLGCGEGVRRWVDEERGERTIVLSPPFMAGETREIAHWACDSKLVVAAVAKLRSVCLDFSDSASVERPYFLA